MAHHNFDGLPNELRSMILGATGQYPHGQYNAHDEGEIRFAVAADTRAQRVLVDFGKPVHSLGLTGEQASELADLLHTKALELRGIT